MLRLLLPSVTLCTLAVALAVTGVRAQTDLDAGKSGPQLFAQDCVACHRSPQGLMKNTSSFGLVGFLRQHYTSSSASANALAAYITSVANARPPADPKKGKGADPQQQQAKQAPPAREPRAGAAQPPDAAQAHARPGESAHDPTDQRANRRLRRPAPAETATAPPAPETTTTIARPGVPAEAVPPPAAQQTAAAPQAAPPPAAPPPVPAEPGFAEPLP